MKAIDIEHLLRVLGCERVRTAPTVVSARCPLASWKHRAGRDKNPSFWVKIKNDDASNVGCYACGFHGSLNELLFKMQLLSGRDLSDCFLFVRERDQADFGGRLARLKTDSGLYSEPGNGKMTIAWTGGKDYSNPLVMSAAVKELPASHSAHVSKMIEHMTDDVLAYLHGPERRFTVESVKKWRIGWHPGASRVSVPQYDHIGRLVNIGGRYLETGVPLGHDWKPPKWMHTTGFDRGMFLFGEDKIDVSEEGVKVGFIVEGAFDVIFLNQQGVPNVVAINGSYINRTQIEKAVKWFDHIVIVMDGDDAGRDAADRLERAFAKRVMVSRFDISDGRDPNDLTDDEIDSLKSSFLS